MKKLLLFSDKLWRKRSEQGADAPLSVDQLASSSPSCVFTHCVPSTQDYPKLSQSFYSLLEVLTQDHMNFIASLEPHVVMYILSSISEGLTALGREKRETPSHILTGGSAALKCLWCARWPSQTPWCARAAAPVWTTSSPTCSSSCRAPRKSGPRPWRRTTASCTSCSNTLR